MAENKSAKTPADGSMAWGCQCGRAYTVTCLSSKPSKHEWFDCSDEQLIEEVRRRGFLIRNFQIEVPKQWVGLTDEEVEDIYFDKFSMSELVGFARYIEQALKEKNK